MSFQAVGESLFPLGTLSIHGDIQNHRRCLWGIHWKL